MKRTKREVVVKQVCEHVWRLCRPKPSAILGKGLKPFRECTRCYELEVSEQ